MLCVPFDMFFLSSIYWIFVQLRSFNWALATPQNDEEEKKMKKKKLCFDMHITIGCAHRTHTHTNILYSNF